MRRSIIKAAALVFSALQVGYAYAASCTSKDNTADCAIDVAVLEITSRLCVVILPRPIDHTLVGFKKAATITWQLVDPTPPGYVFTAAGVTFVDPQDNFEDGAIGGDGLTYSWKNKLTKTDDFKYGIAIKHPTSGRTCPALDPWVRNQ